VGKAVRLIALTFILASCPGCGYDRYAWGQPNPPAWGEPDPPSKLAENISDGLFKCLVGLLAGLSANGWR
jgi:hypothetical protein